MAAIDTENQVKTIEATFEAQADFALQLYNSSAKERAAKLLRIEHYLLTAENMDRLTNALYRDLRKPPTESLMAEHAVVISTLRHIRKSLSSWMKDKRVSTPLALTGSSSYIKYESKGKVLIISPWNYPFQLAINPLLYAIAAGCTAILKPSEFSVHTSAFLQEMIMELFDPKEVAIFQGEVSTAQALLSLPFDHIYFTGSPAVGKKIMEAAATHLSSVTLELGGKSPCIIHKDVRQSTTAGKLAWAKLYNNGQTCIAPDHVYIHRDISNNFLSELQNQMQLLYPSAKGDFVDNKDYGRIISSRHFDRIIATLNDAIEKGAKVICGGQHHREDRFIGPTILTNVNSEMLIMKEEIFGPILPVLLYDNLDEVIKDIKRRPKPLAMYIHTASDKIAEYLLDQTTAGSTVVNDFLLQYANHHLPFGGVNNSGIGKTHGRHGFITFTNERAVLKQKYGVTKVLFPPYTKKKEGMAKFITKWLT